MINSLSFDQTLYNKLKLIIEVQRELLSLKNNNIAEIGNYILNRKDIIEKKEGIALLAQCFNDIVDCRPKYIEAFVDLVIYLQQYESSANYLHLLKDCIIQNIHTKRILKSSFLFFIRMLYIRNEIPLNSILNEIYKMPPILKQYSNKAKQTHSTQHTETNNDADNDNNNCEENINDFEEEEEECDVLDEDIEENSNDKNEEVCENFAEDSSVQRLYYAFNRNKKCRAIKWFYPEIKASNSSYIAAANKKINFQAPIIFEKFDSSTISLIMNTGYSQDNLAKAIRDDDIDSFQEIVLKLGCSFNVNQKIKSTSYERCSVLSHDPSLIQYAAFFNSIKIFKYLYLNKADIDEVNFNKYSLAHFALVGGSTEIIHILKQKGFQLCKVIAFSIQFFQNEIFSWLLENYFPKSESDFELMDNYKLNDLIRKNASKYYFHFRDTHSYIEDYEDDDDILRNYDDFHGLKIDRNEQNGKFKFFNFNIVFHTILNSNNYLALFILFNNGMGINEREIRTKRTLLHYAVEKGKFFLIDLLLSNKFIQPSLTDRESLTPIVYSLKYSRENVFNTMINSQKVLNSLTTRDYIMLSYYSSLCKLQKPMEFVQKNWTIYFVEFLKNDDIETFCIAVSYVPLSFFINQIEALLIESFKFYNPDYFCIFANRIIRENSLNFKGHFYFIQQKNKKESSKGFLELCQLLIYYNSDYSNRNNYFEKYKQNRRDHLASHIRVQDYYFNLIDDCNFRIGLDHNQINIHFTNDANLSHNHEIELSLPIDENKKRKAKDKKSNNKPRLNVDDKLDYK